MLECRGRYFLSLLSVKMHEIECDTLPVIRTSSARATKTVKNLDLNNLDCSYKVAGFTLNQCIVMLKLSSSHRYEMVRHKKKETLP